MLDASVLFESLPINSMNYSLKRRQCNGGSYFLGPQNKNAP